MIAPVLAVISAAELLEEIGDFVATTRCPYCRREPGCSHVGDCAFGRVDVTVRALVDDKALATLATLHRVIHGAQSVSARLIRRAEEHAQRELVNRAAAVAEVRQRAGLLPTGKA